MSRWNRRLVAAVGLALLPLFGLAMAQESEAQILGSRPVSAAGYNRDQIRSMPLLERPNRPGHFYGNTVRRLHRMGFGR